MRPGPAAPVLAVALALALLPQRQAAAAEQRVVAIGGREMRVALPDGECFFDSDRTPDRGLVDQLGAASGGDFVVLLAFTGCRLLDAWRRGDAGGLSRLGYFMIADAHLEPVFAFDQPTLAEAISRALQERGVTDYRANVAHLARDLEAAWKTLPAGGRRELGIVHRDRYGPVEANVLAVPGAGGRTMPRVMLHQTLVLAGKVISVVAARDYRTVESIFDTYGDLSATVEATSSRN